MSPRLVIHEDSTHVEHHRRPQEVDVPLIKSTNPYVSLLGLDAYPCSAQRRGRTQASVEKQGAFMAVMADDSLPQDCIALLGYGTRSIHEHDEHVNQAIVIVGPSQ